MWPTVILAVAFFTCGQGPIMWQTNGTERSDAATTLECFLCVAWVWKPFLMDEQ